MRGEPPCANGSHTASTSSIELQATRKETAGVNLNSGPAADQPEFLASKPDGHQINRAGGGIVQR
jgi:hypothetical protein